MTAEGKNLNFCPCCGAKLTKKDTFDKLIVSRSCEQGHEWYTDVVDLNRVEVWRSLDIQVDHADPIQVIRSWITEPDLRKYLHPQTAEAFRAIIRKIDDSDFGKRNVERYNYNFCISCGTQVTPLPADDWDNPYVCANGHHQRSRGGRFGRYIKDDEDPSRGIHVEIKWEIAPSNGYRMLEQLSRPSRSGFFMQTLKPSSSIPKQIVKILPKIKKATAQ